MKHIQFVKAYRTLQKLSDFSLPVREAFEIFKLTKALQPAHEFAAKMERQLIEKYKGEVNDDGSVNFVHGDDEKSRSEGINNMNKFVAELDELNDTEMDYEFEPIKLSYDAMDGQKISANEIMALDGFVIFE